MDDIPNTDKNNKKNVLTLTAPTVTCIYLSCIFRNNIYQNIVHQNSILLPIKINKTFNLSEQKWHWTKKCSSKIQTKLLRVNTKFSVIITHLHVQPLI